MVSDDTPELSAGDLSIRPELGEIRNARGDCTRLGPINMKVLALLVRRQGQVVSRNELFESVWPNQVVSDDALTRAISDIRAELGRLSDFDGHIETIPKRGYRWTGGTPAKTKTESAPVRVATRAGRVLSYFALLVLTASLGVWLLERFAQSGPPIVALLPVQAEPAKLELASTIDASLVDALLTLERIELLSRTAVDTSPANPYPYFYYEFGARWLIEPRIRELPDRLVLTAAVVDARTGIVLFQTTAPLPGETAPPAIVAELDAFVESQLAE
jgi:DNA-binding winged helix-turn-helix (wHTH) protein